MRSEYYLSDYISHVLEALSDKYQNKVVNPRLISCFVVEERNGKMYYYPVTSIKTIEKQVDGYSYSNTYAEININTYMYCQNPIGIKTDITGVELLHLEEMEEKKIESYHWLCPQLNERLHPIYPKSAEPEISTIISEGILLFMI